MCIYILLFLVILLYKLKSTLFPYTTLFRSINIVVKDDDYKLFDDKNNLIEKDYYNDIISELANEGISNDDLLISTLIVIAPKKIIIHGKEKDKEKEIVEIIDDVFTNKVHYCLDCEICRKKKTNKKGK